MIANAGIAVMTSLLDSTFDLIPSTSDKSLTCFQPAPLDQWQKVLDVNTTGVFLCYREAAKSMIERGIKGRIVGACSVAGKKGKRFCTFYIFLDRVFPNVLRQLRRAQVHIVQVNLRSAL